MSLSQLAILLRLLILVTLCNDGVSDVADVTANVIDDDVETACETAGVVGASSCL